MQELDQWKEQISHLLNVANDYIREIPTDQLYAAAAIAVFTTLILLLREWVRLVAEFLFFWMIYSFSPMFFFL